MAIWPFTRAKPGGYVDNDVPTHGELNKIDDQVAQAANGIDYTDTSILRNIVHASSALTDRGAELVWTGERFLSFGVTGGVPQCSASRTGEAWTSIGSMGGTGLGTFRMSAAANGSGSVVVGVDLALAGAAKIRQSADHGATWNVRNTADSSRQRVTTVRWFAAASLFVAQLDDGNIETSPDGITWTAQTVPGPLVGPSKNAMDVSPTAICALTGDYRILRSTDGINWTNTALGGWATGGSGAAPDYVLYIPDLNRFLALGDDDTGGYDASASDDDGVTWSGSGLTPIAALGQADAGHSAYGRVVVLGQDTDGIAYSVDGGASWLKGSAHTARATAIGRGQLVFAESVSGIHRASIALGI